MNKIFLLLFLGFAFVSTGFAAEGQIVYETATSSAVVKTVALSTSTAVRITPSRAQSLRGDGKSVTWYSTTMFNVNASTAAYAFGSSETVAPTEATCVKGAPIPTGTIPSPGWITEQAQGTYLWGIACGAAAMDLKVVFRGR